MGFNARAERLLSSRSRSPNPCPSVDSKSIAANGEENDNTGYGDCC